ncbi:MAG TPA: primosomal protein N' [Gammaproteobacteria bacterium]|nr:primosomal protein N' [Gammaproteobacteria bacterium]
MLSVAIPSPAGDSFEYLPGGDQPGSLQPGQRVRVDFAGRALTGVIVAIRETGDCPPDKLKPVKAVLDSEPVVPANILELLERVARYYHHPLGEAIFTALPARLRQHLPADGEDPVVWRAASDASLDQVPRRAYQQRALLERLQAAPDGLPVETLRLHFKDPRALLKALAERGLVESRKAPVGSLPKNGTPNQSGPVLNDEQQAAVDALESDLGAFQVSLLDGVTGSGKTEVYLAVIETVLARGGQALVLAPEISLTPQLERRFRARLGETVAVMHSALNDTERFRAWRAASQGEAKVIIGTRSAVFTAFKALQLIIVDEEHDSSLKQQSGLRYHGRDVAILRGQLTGCPVILGSATPSLESLNNARQGKYRHLRLTRRAGNARPPRLHLVDLRRQELAEGLSRFLMERMRVHLGQGRQVMLFLNRRGYTPLMLCHECGTPVDCPRCAAHTVWHAPINQIRCHHCGYQARPPARCPSCGEPELVAIGLGAQKLEQVVRSCFPNEPLIRIDRDSMTRKDDLPRALAAIAAGEYNIIIGTQLLAKGHDFPNITLVGIVDVDQGLFSTDFHAPEKLVQQVIQVSGRAGRGDEPGEVVMQTHQPEHPLLRQLLCEDYAEIATGQLLERAEADWPPWAHLALIRASAPKGEAAMEFLEEAARLFRDAARDEVEALGPVTAPMTRKAGRFRFQLLLRAPKRGPLHRALDQALPAIRKLKTARRARWSVDVDPVDMM